MVFTSQYALLSAKRFHDFCSHKTEPRWMGIWKPSHTQNPSWIAPMRSVAPHTATKCASTYAVIMVPMNHKTIDCIIIFLPASIAAGEMFESFIHIVPNTFGWYQINPTTKPATADASTAT